MKKITLPLLFAVFAIFPSSKLAAQDNQSLINNYIQTNHLRDYKKSDLMNFTIDIVDHSVSMQGDIIKFQQLYKGFPIFNSVGSAVVKDGKVVYFSDTFVKNYDGSTSNIPSITVKTALSTIADNLNNSAINDFQILKPLDADLINEKFVKQNLLFVNYENNMRLAYQVAFQDPKSSSYWSFIIDANNKTVLYKEDLNLSCNFYHDAYNHDHSTHQKFVGPHQESSVDGSFNLLIPDAASYNVFPFPIEAPTFGARSVVTNPWIVASSPEGWHYDGITHYTTSRGNNVFAYEDVAGTALSVPPLYLPGVPVDGGASRNFNFPFNINGTPASNLNASITNLFYANNKVHDIFHKFGFNEISRNFQTTNFGLGGSGNDHVMAEAQDGGGTNNANFSTPQDGSRPRMQMYLWSQTNRIFYYNAPVAAVPRQPLAGIAQFGPALTATGVTGNVQLSSVLEGCTAIPAGSLTGKIGLIQRGTCDFVVKVKNAQNAGAIGAIVYNAPTSAAIGNMGGTDATITIPSVLIDNPEGEYIKTHLTSNNTVNVTLKNDPAAGITPDGSFDNGIIIHEYGHGISNRLTGDGSTCLSSSASKEQMGEGWSDFFALMLTNQPGDNASVPRGMATYAAGQGISGNGIRPAKYSPNFAINNFTYTDTNGMEYPNDNLVMVPDVHSIGFVWATMLWDLHWDYVTKYGYASDVTANTTSGSARVLQLVTNALKLQVCNPTFVNGRDAILAAELATTAGADRCMIWRAFAKRGLGSGASAGVKTDINDQVESFAVPADCVLSTNETTSVKDNAISIYPNPAKNEFFINFPKNTLGKVNVEIYDMSGKLVSTENKVSPDSKKAISTSNLVNGTYLVKVNGLGIDATSKLLIQK